MRRLTLLWLVTLVACDGSKARQDGAGSSGAGSGTVGAEPPAPAAASGAATGSAAASAAPAAAAVPGVSASAVSLAPTPHTGPFPETETKPPKPGEWDTQAQFFPVKHASTLWCETRTLREWVRVSCRAKPGSANKPIGVEVVKKPGRGQAYEFAREGQVTSVVVQPRRGQSSEFAFTWSNWGSRTLKVTWDPGAERPTVEFESGAPTTKAGLPRCEDVCPTGSVFHQLMSDCNGGCGPGYSCHWIGEGAARTAMCFCDTECGEG